MIIINPNSFKDDIDFLRDRLKSINTEDDKRNLYNEIETIRKSISDCFLCGGDGKECVPLLEDLFSISEDLKRTYVCPALYNLSIEIYDTINDITHENYIES